VAYHFLSLGIFLGLAASQTTQPASGPTTRYVGEAEIAENEGRPLGIASTQTGGHTGRTASLLERDRRLSMLYLTLATIAAGLLGFLLVSFILLRILRAGLPKTRTKPTEYVDAWANYRITPEQIEEATREDPKDEPPPPDGAGKRR
jgi:hypothetical protein